MKVWIVTAMPNMKNIEVLRYGDGTPREYEQDKYDVRLRVGLPLITTPQALLEHFRNGDGYCQVDVEVARSYFTP